MPTLEVRCKVPLPGPIVLAAQRDDYPTITWTSRLGNELTATLVIPHEDVHAILHGGTSFANYYANVRVEQLILDIKMLSVTGEDLDKLHGRTSADEKFVFCGREVNRVPGVAEPVSAEIADAVTGISELVRSEFQQFWIDKNFNEPEAPQLPQNRFIDLKAKWKRDDGEWCSLVVDHTGVVIAGVSIGGAESYLQEADWKKVESGLRNSRRPSIAATLLADARAKYALGDEDLAILLLNVALEWCVGRFLETRLAAQIPRASLDALLKQPYERLLRQWVQPLEPVAGIDLDAERADIGEIRELRNKAVHAVSGRVTPAVSNFQRLCHSTAGAIFKLTGERFPDPLPPLLNCHSSGGNGGPPR